MRSSYEAFSVTSGLCLAAVREKEVFSWAAAELLQCTAGRQQRNRFLAETAALQAALLHPRPASSHQVQLKSSHGSHWIGKGPSWRWSELGGSSCVRVFETCCLPAETCDECLQDATHAWWDATGPPGCHPGFRFANMKQERSPEDPAVLNLMILFFTFILK